MDKNEKIQQQNSLNEEIVEPTLANVIKLREMTGAKIMACKKALKNEGSFEKAIQYLIDNPIVDKI